jgi:hypothetical protein
MPVTYDRQIEDRPPGYFVHIYITTTTPTASALKNCHAQILLEVPMDFFTTSGSRWYKLIAVIMCNGHYPTDTSARSGLGVTAM